MNAQRKLAISEGFSDETARRKRLGQYFTGTGLARLLAALASADSARSILDPMAGNGDMLVACREYGASLASFGAVEIDPIAKSSCAERAPWSSPILGNAFDPETIGRLGSNAWDLVITNPPYVRYQTFSKGAGSGFRLPSGDEVRNGLLEIVGANRSLDGEDRALFSELVSGYSGLADLAVPSWLLCATMCAPGGKLALVLPESWLSRDYAAIVQYLLLRWFRIKYVVEDVHAAWFADAQVKTTLLVAERIARKPSAFDWNGGESFLRIRLSRGTIGAGGMVDGIFPETAGDPEWRFAEMAEELFRAGRSVRTDLLDAEAVPIAGLADNLRRRCSGTKWFRKLERQPDADSARDGGGHAMPDALASWLSGGVRLPKLTTLEALGAKVGQGLRTGANAFFYADAVADAGTDEMIETSAAVGKVRASVPKEFARAVLRKQNELPKGYVVAADGLRGRVLAIRSHALPEDDPDGAYLRVPDGAARIIRNGSEAEIDGKRVWQLSAVAPNVRRGNPAKGIPPRFWYMLPDFAGRHLPDLLVARVNGGTPKTFLNEDRGAVVDANFSTVCVPGGSAADKWALLAMLNSSWCRAAMELSAAVMGGGALKVEAAHLRRLPIPDLSGEEWERLSLLGQALADGIDADVRDAIDAAVTSGLLGRRAMKKECRELAEIGENARVRREGMGRGVS